MNLCYWGFPVIQLFFNIGSCLFQNMLCSLDMEFEGHPHSGLDDAKNIARVLVNLSPILLYMENSRGPKSWLWSWPLGLLLPSRNADVAFFHRILFYDSWWVGSNSSPVGIEATVRTILPPPVSQLSNVILNPYQSMGYCLRHSGRAHASWLRGRGFKSCWTLALTLFGVALFMPLEEL